MLSMRSKYLILLCFIERYTITNTTNLAVDVVARLAIIDAVAVADVEAQLGAKAPDGVLHKPRENSRKPRIERTSVDFLGSAANNFGAAAGPVAGRAVGVLGAESFQDAGAVQEIVHQRVDGDHGGADLAPGLKIP